MPKNIKVIKGHVFDKNTNLGIPNITVEGWNYYENRLLISTVTDQDGKYRLNYDFSKERSKRPNVFLKVLKHNFLIVSTKDNTIKIRHDNKITQNFYIETVRSIVGKVTDHKDNPEPNYKVKVFNKIFGKDVLLNETVVDEAGEFALFYIVELSLSKTAPDIKVKLYTPDDVELIDTPVKINAGIEETYNFVTGETEFIGKDVLSKLQETLADIAIDGVDFTTVSDKDTNVLAKELNISERDLKYHIRAKQIFKDLDFTETTSLNEELIFGLLKSGNSVEPSYFLTQDKSTLSEQLKDAISKNYINSDIISSDEEINTVIADLKILAVNNAEKSIEGEVSLYSIFANTSIATENKNTEKDLFLKEYLKNDKIDSTFLENINKLNLSDLDIEKIKFNLDLTVFTGYSYTAFNQIQSENLANLKQLAFADINWLKTVAGTTTFPENIQNETEFAKHLEDKIARAYPSQIINGKLARAADTEFILKNYLTNNPDFEYRFNNITLTEQDVADVEQRKKLKTDLQTIQRKLTILPEKSKLEAFDFMSTNDLNSAHSIVKLGKTAFLNLAENNLDSNLALELYANATLKNSKSLVSFANYSPQINPNYTNVLPYLSYNNSDAPDLENLFNGFDSCECKDCRSTLGPAAYLADNLMFFQKIKTTDNSNLFDKFDARRPDIKHLLLNCKNTDTLVPYIDIVNEVLERAIAGTLKNDASYYENETENYQTDWETDEIDANPEHIINSVYDTLNGAVSPINLPFNYAYEQTKGYLAQLNLNFYDIIDKFTEQSNLTSEYAANYLGFSKEERRLITSINGSNYTEEIVPRITDSSAYVDIPEFLKISKIEYNELIELLKSEFINKNNRTLETNTCTITSAKLQFENYEIYKLLSFKRLLLKTNWTVNELDKVLLAFNQGNTDNILSSSIINIANIIKLQKITGLPVEELLSWWKPMVVDSLFDEKQQFYHSKFLNKVVEKQETNIFKLNESGKITLEENGNTKLIETYISEIAAVTNLTEKDIKFIKNNFYITELTRHKLEFFARIASFCKAFDITIPEYIKLTELTGQKAITPTSGIAIPINTLDFIEMLNSIKESGFSIADLVFLLTNNNDLNSNLFVSKEYIDKFLSLLSKALEKAKDENETKNIDKFTLLEDSLKYLLSQKISFDNTFSQTYLSEEERIAIIEKILLIIKKFDISHSPFNEFIDSLPDSIFPDKTTAINNLTIDGELETVEERLDYVLGELDQNKLQVFKYSNIIVEAFAKEFNISFDIVNTFLELLDIQLVFDLINVSIESNTDNNNYTELYKKIYKASIFINNYNIKCSDIAKIMTNDVLLNIMNIEVGTDWLKWQKLNSAFTLNKKYFESSEKSIFDFLIDTTQIETDTKNNTATEKFLSATNFLETIKWEKDEFTYITQNHFNFTDYKDPSWFKQTTDVFQIINTIGLSAEKIVEWISAFIGGNISQIRVTSEIRNALKSKYSMEQWKQVSAQIMKPLREKRRDALVSYLLFNNYVVNGTQVDFNDTTDLYSYFFLDVEMSACNKTSRIVLAQSAMQLFAMRILLNMDANTKIRNDSNQEFTQWKWRKKYRVWEANRKVFLFPENWLEPELRDDKSELFEALEDSLLQNEITDTTTSKMFTDYVNELDIIAKLQIAQHYYYEDTGDLYVFARTFNSPHIYYFRKKDNLGYWSAWEKINVDITGNNLIPVMYNNKLHIFWSSVSDALISETNHKKIYLEWSIYDGNKWLSKNKSKTYIYTNHFSIRNLFLFSQVENNNLKIFVTPNKLGNLTNTNDVVIDDEEINTILADALTYLQGLEISGTYGFHALNGLDGGMPDGFYLIIEGNSFESLLPDGSGSLVPIIIKTHRNSLISLIENYVPTTTQEIEEIIFDEIHTYEFEFNEKNNIEQSKSIYQYQIKNIDGKAEHNRIRIDSDGVLRIVQDGQTEILVNDGDEDLKLLRWDNDTINKKDIIDLSIVENTIYVTLPHQYPFFKSQAPFFLEEKKRVLLIEPYNSSISNQTSNNNLEYGANLINPLIIPVIKNPETNLDFSPLSSKSVINSNTYNTIPATNNKSREYSSPGPINTPTALKYRFYNFYHPYTHLFARALNKYGLDELLNPTKEERLVRQNGFNDFFENDYNPNTNNVSHNYPIANIDFEFDGTYSLYNWELFYHAPLLVATRLSKNQRFEDAQKWFHYIFDPTRTDANDATTDKYWRIKPFANFTGELTIEEIIKDLNSAEVQKWQENPFNPHLIARMRIVSYMKNVLMKYIDNLVAWGDYLFQKDSIEYINEAAQVYILAAQILGRKPVKISQEYVSSKNYNEIANNLDSFGNILIDIENTQNSPIINNNSDKYEGYNLGSLQSILYFCIPENSKILSYWDIVADRLFKIRHCQNISGIERQLALFEAPIDPALLIRAIANGVDIGAAINDLSAPNPLYKFRYVLQKALELTSDVKSLGQSFLSALEKKDAEQLSLLRAGHEISMQNAITSLKEYSINESTENINSLEVSKTNISFRKHYYLRKEYKNIYENLQITNLNKANALQIGSQGVSMLASALALIPEFETGVPCVSFTFGGRALSTAASIGAGILNLLASIKNHEATIASIEGGYKRRQQDWDFQVDSANNEIKQVEKQIVAAEIRRDIAKKDKENHLQQIANSQEARVYMENKFTNQELYNWMSGELSTLYFNTYQTAYQLAKQAEKALQFELGIDNTNYIQSGHWDGLKKGLLAGENLHFQLKQMEIAYMNQNEREYEITKQISLAQINPYALLQFKETGTCNFQVPEVLFDLDYPGQYFRRIKSVSVTIPAVTGPYTNINCKVSLIKNRIRKSTDDSTNYLEDTANDSRFAYDYIAKSIATSSGMNDSGLFELNFNDERYLPFEGRGVIGEWQLELPKEYRQFDYNTISDVILTVNYTAKEGGIKTTVETALNDQIDSIIDTFIKDKTGLYRAVSLKSEFANNLHQFLNPINGGTHTTEIELTKQHFPYFLNDKTLSSNGDVKVYVKLKKGQTIAGETLLTLNDAVQTEIFGTSLSDDIFETVFNNAFTFSAENPIASLILGATAGTLDEYEIEDIILMFNYTIS